MRTFTKTTLLFLSFILSVKHLVAQDQTVESITVTQMTDTFALKGMPAQPVIKVNIRVAGSGNPLYLQRFVVRTLNQLNTDVDSVAVCWSFYDRFSFADYPGEEYLLEKRKKIVGDSISIKGISYQLNTGDNYFWVTMDLNKYSPASHTLDAYIPANGVTISGVTYPAADESPTGNVAIADVYFRENFEKKDLNGRPLGWSQDRPTGFPYWINNIGGFTISTSGHPSSAKSGQYNIMIEKESFELDSTMVFKQIDLSLATNPQLSFYHSQVAWLHNTDYINDKLRLFYKIGSAGTWKQIKYYELATPNHWLKREILLPSEAANKNFYLGFKGITNFGWGTCVDSVVIYETGVVDREVKAIDISQPVQDMVPQGADQNPIMRINLRVKGNNNSITLNSIKVTSLNTSDSDIKTGGVRLYYTQDSVFMSPTLWGTAQSFSGGVATFSSLSKVLETGDNFLWVTYDVNSNAFPGHILDAKINSGDISMSGVGVTGLFPATDQSPAGSRLVKQTIFFDSFENASPVWTLTGEFQIAHPNGLGGLNNGGPDPLSAYSLDKVLGTDLTGLGSNPGDYEPNIPFSAPYLATSPLIDGKYFKNIGLSFYRWLNVDNTDTAFIEYKLQTESAWKKIWKSQIKYVDTDWKIDTFPNLNFLDRTKFNIRFGLSSDAIDNYSGWNIDYLFFTADSVPYDAAITQYKYPLTSCDLSASEHVQVYVKNEGPNPLINTPIKLSINGGKSFITEPVPGPINPDDSVLYTFTTAVDLSKPSVYNIIVKVAHPRDNYPQNDSIAKTINALPTYNLPYRTGFEQDTTFWYDSGLNSSWIEDYNTTFPPVEGTKCWKTDYSGFHFLDENSHVESPCFNFTGKEIPMIDVKYSFNINNLTGAILEYSLDQGQTWTYAKEDSYPFLWNWYNDTVPTLKHKGWTGQTVDGSLNQVWKQGRQILPAVIANQNKVRFRITFKSDSTNISRMPGFAFDDVKIYDAPFDLGVTSINSMNNPACQFENSPYLNVTIKNFGYRRMLTGDTIIVGAKVNGVLQAVDTFKLASNLIKDATLNYTFKKRVNFDAAGSYTIKAFTMIENDKTFYGGANNDSASVSFTVNQNPITNMKKSYSTARLDTLVLTPNYSGSYTYFWQYNSNTATTPTYPASNVGTYYLTVTNSGTGCQTKDTINVYALQLDAGVTQIIAPLTSCSYGTAFKPIVKIKNFGTDTLAKGKSIPIKLRLNSGSIISDAITLTKAIAPDSSIIVSVNTTLNLSVAGAYQLMVRTDLSPYDINAANDSIKNSFTIYGYPSVELGPDIYSKTLNYTLTAPSGYSSYLWSDNSTNNALVVTNTGKYIVTVTNSDGCQTKDSVFVRLSIHDLSIKRVMSPVTFCTKPGLSTISCKVMNNGTDTIKTSEIPVMSYTLNSGTAITQNLILASNLLPGDSVTFTFISKEDIHLPSTYNFLIKATTANDLRRENDSVTNIVKVFPNPIINFGADILIHALEYKLAPGNNYTSYKWQDNSTDSVYTITQTHKNTLDDTYSVIVTDANGCVGGDTIHVYFFVDDLKLDSIDIPSQVCSQPFPVKVKVSNSGSETYVNKDLVIRYKVNEDPEVIEAFKYTGNPGNSTFFTFNTLVTPNKMGANKIKATIEMIGDLRRNNDTLTRNLNILNGVNIDFAAINDTLNVDLPYTLDAGSGTNYSYAWNTSATTQTISVPSNGKYAVTVTDGSCTSSKSVTVINKVYDLAITGIKIGSNFMPFTDCKSSKKQAVGIELQNMGTVSISSQSITISYQINSGTPMTKMVLFTGGKLEKSLYFFDDSLDLSQAAVSKFYGSLAYGQDKNPSNDTLTRLMNILEKPTISFASAVRDTIKTRTLPVILDPGSGTNYSYAWYDGSTTRTISTVIQRWHTVTVSNGYCAAKDSVWVTDATPIQVINSQATLLIYPNPVLDVLNINLSVKTNEEVILEFISSAGAIVKTDKLSGNTQYIHSIDVSDLTRGLYYLRIYRKNWVMIEKVVIR